VTQNPEGVRGLGVAVVGAVREERGGKNLRDQKHGQREKVGEESKKSSRHAEGHLLNVGKIGGGGRGERQNLWERTEIARKGEKGRFKIRTSAPRKPEGKRGVVKGVQAVLSKREDGERQNAYLNRGREPTRRGKVASWGGTNRQLFAKGGVKRKNQAFT